MEKKFEEIYNLDKKNNIINLNLKNIKFCPGPCKYITNEPEPVNIKKKVLDNNNIFIEYKNKNLYYFKPHNGKNYESLCYPINYNRTLYLNNVRICTKCYNEYLNNWEKKEYKKLEKNAKTIINKIKKNI